MSNEATQTKQINHLSMLMEQVKTSKTKAGAYYLAQIMGMWAHVYGVSWKHNPFIGKNVELSSNWNSGWRASAYRAEPEQD